MQDTSRLCEEVLRQNLMTQEILHKPVTVKRVVLNLLRPVKTKNNDVSSHLIFTVNNFNM